MDDELKTVLRDFLVAFYLVFENDWEFTASNILDSDKIGEDGTFLNPKVEDERNNWGNRGALLCAYRRLLDLLRLEGEQTEDDHWGQIVKAESSRGIYAQKE